MIDYLKITTVTHSVVGPGQDMLFCHIRDAGLCSKTTENLQAIPAWVVQMGGWDGMDEMQHHHIIDKSNPLLQSHELPDDG
jgi:hypothetical protein